MKVANKKCITNLSKKSLRANKTRNRMAVAAIILTTVLFTALFTVGGTMLYSFEQETMRQVGGDMHGTFKYVTKEQIDKLSKHPLIKSDGKRLVLGVPVEAPFNKQHTEISYMDENCAKGYFCYPKQGRLPKEGTKEMACDTKVLELLGAKPELGEELTITYDIGLFGDANQTVTDTFTLCGWWEFDDVSQASMAVVPLSYVEEKLADYKPVLDDDSTGTWDYNVNFQNAKHIEQDMHTVLEDCGYQSEDTDADNYIAIGMNWAYLSAQASQAMDPVTVVIAVLLVIVFMLSGYLIIYNIFQIAVVNDIRFYGMLKTIGTTHKQIRRIIYRQAFYLSLIGIPIGLVLGFICGNVLAPVIMSTMNYKKTFVTANPLIFVGAALFSLFTVFISCIKPGKMAGRVSPIEALRYTEGNGMHRGKKKRNQTFSIYRMALSNLNRNRKKTVMVVLSLSLTVVLLHVVVTFVKGFDMDAYLEKEVVADYQVGSAGYFQYKWGYQDETPVSAEAIEAIRSQGGIEKEGCVYGVGTDRSITTKVTEEVLRNNHRFAGEEEIQNLLEWYTKEDGIWDYITLSGMEELPLSRLKVIDGDISKVIEQENYILAAYDVDDYENVIEESNFVKTGDEITLHYEIWESFDVKTGEALTDEEVEQLSDDAWENRLVDSWEETYTVAATVVVPYPLGYRHGGNVEFVLDANQFKKDTKTDTVMTYDFDVREGAEQDMESFMENYTKKVDPSLDYDSKQKYVEEFNGFCGMFTVVGSVLCIIVGMIGVLNFLNAMITSIMTRKREFAMLKSIGMTEKQLKKMLVYEGGWYAILTIILSFVLCGILSIFIGDMMSSMFWFFRYHFTMTPIAIVTPIFLIIGIVIPYVVYHFFRGESIVEKLREAE